MAKKLMLTGLKGGTIFYPGEVPGVKVRFLGKFSHLFLRGEGIIFLEKPPRGKRKRNMTFGKNFYLGGWRLN
ncbi:MAG: hypothetical protein CM15mP31_3190 [Gammaproteobacteria bacterium]|nr:MAG: hypothetical protein CM15mP31_3190 [Gammaproteobacteria bacterium]